MDDGCGIVFFYFYFVINEDFGVYEGREIEEGWR